MSVTHLLEDFGQSLAETDFDGSRTTEAIETRRLEAFEEGYKAGWDDAVAAQADEKSRISADFAKNLQDLSFTYHEAYSHVIKAINPLLQQIVESVLPELARRTLGPHVVEQLGEMAKGQAETNVEIVVAPANFEALEQLMQQEFGFPVRVVQEASLGDGQVHLRFGSSERQIDLDEVLAGIGQAVAGFFHETKKEAAHG